MPGHVEPNPTATAPARESGDVVEQLERSASSLLTAWALRGVFAFAGLGGAAFGVSAGRQHEDVSKKLDHVVESLELQGKALEGQGRKLDETTHALDTLSRAWDTLTTESRALRHEERIRKLEDQAQASILDRNGLRLELEALKKEKR